MDQRRHLSYIMVNFQKLRLFLTDFPKHALLIKKIGLMEKENLKYYTLVV